jgi:hypothetical protein
MSGSSSHDFRQRPLPRSAKLGVCGRGDDGADDAPAGADAARIHCALAHRALTHGPRVAIGPMAPLDAVLCPGSTSGPFGGSSRQRAHCAPSSSSGELRGRRFRPRTSPRARNARARASAPAGSARGKHEGLLAAPQSSRAVPRAARAQRSAGSRRTPTHRLQVLLGAAAHGRKHPLHRSRATLSTRAVVAERACLA